MKAGITARYRPKDRRPTTLPVATKVQVTQPSTYELALSERVKELHCLQQIEQVIGANQGTLDDLLQQTVEAIPQAWLHAAHTVARISRGASVYQTGDLDQCPAIQSSAISANETIHGCVEVGYTERFAEAIEGPCLA